MTRYLSTDRRASGNGTVYQLADGRFRAEVAYYRYTGDRQRRHFLRRIVPTRAEAEAAVGALLERLQTMPKPYIPTPEHAACEDWIVDARVTLEMWTQQWAGNRAMADALTEALRLLAACPVEVE
jgi:hypothetical protein